MEMALWILFAAFLFFMCAVLLVLEIFIPSFGFLTACSLMCLAGGIATCFRYGLVAGWVGVAIAVVEIPIVWIIAYRMFPNTRFGKHVTLQGPEREMGDAIPDTNELKELLGKQGKVLTPLRPVGMCDFEGKRVECVAETGYIEKDKSVKVIHVEQTQLTVRLVENEN